LTAASVLRLPRDSRLKRTLLERTAHAAYEAWNRDDLVLARGAADPEIQVHFQHAADSPLAGIDEVYRGPDGYCRAMEEWAEGWRSWRVEIEDVVEVAPDKVLITGRHIGEGLASGAEVEQWGAALYTFRRGRILRVDAFLFRDRDSVSEAVMSVLEASEPEQELARVADPAA
jgi:ketosteroid isomerase-like protein